jgi:CheY-like chemotaxis protein
MNRILLIEDNPADVALLRLAFKSAQLDCELTVIEDGAEAMTYVRGGRAPDLVVLDLNLPKNDGIEVLEVIRDAPQYAHVPVAILSSSSPARERAKLAPFAISRFITKPPDLDEFLQIGSTLKSVLENAPRA